MDDSSRRPRGYHNIFILATPRLNNYFSSIFTAVLIHFNTSWCHTSEFSGFNTHYQKQINTESIK